MGEPVAVSSLSLGLVGFGTDVDVRVANEIQRDPDLWTEVVSIDAAGLFTDLRIARPVIGRYVLVWLSGLPRVSGNATEGQYSGGVAIVTLRGTIPASTDV
jgi:hypothetical protein